MKKLAKKVLTQLGYDAVFHPIAKQRYNGPNIAFVHMAKCGGMSVDHALRAAIANPGEPRIDRESTLAASLVSFGKEIKSADDSCEFSAHHAKNLTRLFEFYLAKQWHYVSGHVTTNSALLQKYKDEYHFVTVLRNPVDRFVSNYLYNKKTNLNPYMLPNIHTTDGLIEEAKQIIDSKRGWQMANSITMFLTGRYPESPQDAQNMHNEVMANLSLYSVVGFLDDLPSFASQIQQLTGRDINISKRNQGKSAGQENLTKAGNDYADALADLTEFLYSKSCQKQLEELCKFELKNYQKAKYMS